MNRFRRFGSPPAAAKTIVSDFVSLTVGGQTQAPVTQSGSATVDGTGVDMTGGTGSCVAILNAKNNSGTAPTLVAKMQESDDDASYTDVVGGGFTTVAGNGTVSFQEKTFTRTKKYLRSRATTAGSSPNVTWSVSVHQATQ